MLQKCTNCIGTFSLFLHLDLNLKILRDDSACPGACQVIKWVKGCFDALDKKYVSIKKGPKMLKKFQLVAFETKAEGNK